MNKLPGKIEQNIDPMLEQQMMVDYETATGASFTDSLTGLYNHGFFLHFLEREVRTFERYGDTFTLAMINVDGFAHYNRCFNPLQGDRFLRHVAHTVSENLRRTDLAARYAGDTFVLLMPRTNLRSANQAMERIRRSIGEHFTDAPTLSIGLALCPDHGVTRDSLLQSAQDALYEAKIRGKNRVCEYQNGARPDSENPPTLLVVDDDSKNRKLLKASLLPQGFRVFEAANGEDALAMIRRFEVDLLLLDIMMPGIDGFEVCRRLKSDENTRMIPIVVISALDDVDSKIKAIEAGSDDFLCKPPNQVELLARIHSLVKVKRLNHNLTSIENVLYSLANAIEAKDAYTQGHVERVSSLALSIGRKMALNETELEALKIGGILHDIGKIAVPRDILNKPGKLDENEWRIMRAHTEVGFNICLPLKHNLGAALAVIRHHHERLDGSGYPDHLQGEEIPLVARIMAVVDYYDALKTNRPYRKRMKSSQAAQILMEEARSGKLDKAVVDCLIEIIQKEIEDPDLVPKRRTLAWAESPLSNFRGPE